MFWNFFGRFDFDRRKCEELHGSKMKTYTGQYPIFYIFKPSVCFKGIKLTIEEVRKNTFTTLLVIGEKRIEIMNEAWYPKAADAMERAVQMAIQEALAQRERMIDAIDGIGRLR